jgi:dCMP deaminase
MSDTHYLREAAIWARECSHDPQTKNGAVIVCKNGEMIGAANRFPVSVKHSQERFDRPTKYRYIEHAERAAIYEAAASGVKTHKARLYCPWFACCDCARAIIMAGIREVIGHAKCREATPERWATEVLAAEAMLMEAGVGTRLVFDTLGVTIMFDGKEMHL